MLTYRPDIDGLRALAVLAVIIFHLHPGSLHGGFAGVDIFFVISGFLITSLLIRDIDDNKFSLAGFYERRARRILPALVTVCAATLAAFYFNFFPADYIELARSTIAASISVSNIFFWKTIDYFATASNEKPLLHTWSLGVEEQFYIIFPILLFILDKFYPQKRVAIIVGALGLLSLGFAEYAVRHFPTFAFYQLPARFWELSLGASLAFLKPSELSRQIKTSLASLGFMLLILAFIACSDDSSFPGIAALLPCIGAALLIYAGPGNRISEKLFSAKPVVLIGRMSYSLYLWHWPILAFARYRVEHLGVIGSLIVITLTFILSYLSWRFVETPFRNRNFLTRRNVFLLSATSLLALVAISAAIIQREGLPQRFSAKAFDIANAANDHPPLLYEVCQTKEYQDNPDCQFGERKLKTSSIALWGDSHANALVPLLDGYANERHIKGVQLAKSSCPPLIGDNYSWHKAEFPACKKFNDEVFAYLLAHKEIKTVFLMSRWAPIEEEIKVDGTNDRAFYKALNHTAETLQKNGKHVVFVASMPEIDFSVPRCLSRLEAYGPRFISCTPPTLDQYMDRQKKTLAAFSALGEDFDVFYPYKTLCKSGTCLIQKDGQIFYFDDDHISTHGAKSLLHDLDKAIP